MRNFFKSILMVLMVASSFFLTSCAWAADDSSASASNDEKYWGGDALGGNTSDVSKESVKEATGLDATADPRIIVARVINIILGFLGIIMVCLVLYAGFLWMTSEGNAAKITQAKGIMISASIGLAIVLSSYAIAEMVIREFVDASSGDTALSSLYPKA